MPVPIAQAGGVESPRPISELETPHAMEREVHRRLHSLPGLDIKSLVVHRLPDGVCLEGRIESLDPDVDLKQLMAGIPGLNEIVNHMVVCCPWPRPQDTL